MSATHRTKQRGKSREKQEEGNDFQDEVDAFMEQRQKVSLNNEDDKQEDNGRGKCGQVRDTFLRAF
jgi:hypothetical protein